MTLKPTHVKQSNRKSLWPILTLGICFVIGILGYGLWQQLFPVTPRAPLPSGPQLGIKVPANILKLQSEHGPVDVLTQDNKLRIIYFGFTHCPDVCPTSLAMLAMALNELSEQERSQLMPIFISLDPKRDTPDKMSQYTHYFNPQIIGLTPHPNQLEELSRLLGVYYRYVDMPDSAMTYSVDHSSYFYLLDDKGQLLDQVAHTLSPEPIVTVIRKYLPHP
jgi:protein SCO1/2